MSDRSLLEDAARAYWGSEIDDVCSIEWDEADSCIAFIHADNQDHNGHDVAMLWNPATNSADSSELEALCRIDIEWHAAEVHASHGTITCVEHFADHATPQLARMAASLRCAAEIWRSKQ
jgi:hypothetical protein